MIWRLLEILVVPAEQMSNFFLEDLVRLAKLAAWCKSDSKSSLFCLSVYSCDHHDTKLESSSGRFRLFSETFAAWEFFNVVYLIHFIFVENKQQTMQPKTQTLLPKFQKIFEQMCENIKMGRRRRSLTTIQVAEKLGIDRSCTIPHWKRKSQRFYWCLF